MARRLIFMLMFKKKKKKLEGKCMRNSFPGPHLETENMTRLKPYRILALLWFWMWVQESRVCMCNMRVTRNI